ACIQRRPPAGVVFHPVRGWQLRLDESSRLWPPGSASSDDVTGGRRTGPAGLVEGTGAVGADPGLAGERALTFARHDVRQPARVDRVVPQWIP
ncbi:MAG TPA: hypothetical protein VM121_00030, partial [Acidimicrobiales bacterium]|nr:hypothetical protein [Acidimicrobiales bacterium]